MRIFLGLILCIYLIVILFGFSDRNPCKDRISYKDIHINGHLDKEQLLAVPGSGEINAIINEWRTISYNNIQYNIIKESSYLLSRKLLLIEHSFEGVNHYGALILPKGGYNSRNSGLIVLASGLDQRNPTVSIDRNYWLRQMAQGCEEMAILVPSFRGQALKSEGDYYCSDGFFGDAYDGAAIDALRLIEVAEILYPGITEHVYVYGISRGATVGTLMAARKNDIDLVVAQSGPYDFMGDYAYNTYGRQFKYQFLSLPKEKDEIRKKIIQSSPIYFSSFNRTKLLLIHGRNDNVCSFSKAEEFCHSFSGSDLVEHIWMNGSHTLNVFDLVIEHIQKLHSSVILNQEDNE